MRFCRACNETKPDGEFSKSSRAKSGLQTYCKPCHVRMESNNPNRAERYARYKARYPARVTWSSIKKRAEKLGVPVDGSLGYIEGNLVLACHRCNVVKNGYLTHAQMMQVAGMFFGGPVNNHEALVKALQLAEAVLNEYALQKGGQIAALSPIRKALSEAGAGYLAPVGSSGKGEDRP